jgi:hypothetical protein
MAMGRGSPEVHHHEAGEHGADGASSEHAGVPEPERRDQEGRDPSWNREARWVGRRRSGHTRRHDEHTDGDQRAEHGAPSVALLDASREDRVEADRRRDREREDDREGVLHEQDATDDRQVRRELAEGPRVTEEEDDRPENGAARRVDERRRARHYPDGGERDRRRADCRRQEPVGERATRRREERRHRQTRKRRPRHGKARELRTPAERETRRTRHQLDRRQQQKCREDTRDAESDAGRTDRPPPAPSDGRRGAHQRPSPDEREAEKTRLQLSAEQRARGSRCQHDPSDTATATAALEAVQHERQKELGRERMMDDPRHRIPAVGDHRRADDRGDRRHAELAQKEPSRPRQQQETSQIEEVGDHRRGPEIEGPL